MRQDLILFLDPVTASVTAIAGTDITHLQECEADLAAEARWAG
jgi:hypothetical protein